MYTAIAESCNLPLILYNVPSRTGVNIEPATYAALAEVPNITAIKEANGNISKIVETAALVGDKLDIFEKDGSICIMPVVVYPKHYLNELKEEISDVKAKLASGEQPVFDSVDALFDKLEAE
jgi:6-phosphofructokinase